MFNLGSNRNEFIEILTVGRGIETLTTDVNGDRMGMVKCEAPIADHHPSWSLWRLDKECRV